MRKIQGPYTVLITPSKNGVENSDIVQMVARVSALIQSAEEDVSLGQLGSAEETLFDICDALRPDYTSLPRECLVCGVPDCLAAH
jgi:hypothetical protein